MTMMNCAQKPPGRLVRNSLTSSSPPNARNADVSIAAPSRMMNTSEVVLAVSIITPRSVSVDPQRAPAAPDQREHQADQR
jgi:hypothetical protein